MISLVPGMNDRDRMSTQTLLCSFPCATLSFHVAGELRACVHVRVRACAAEGGLHGGDV